MRIDRSFVINTLCCCVGIALAANAQILWEHRAEVLLVKEEVSRWLSLMM